MTINLSDVCSIVLETQYCTRHSSALIQPNLIEKKTVYMHCSSKRALEALAWSIQPKL